MDEIDWIKSTKKALLIIKSTEDYVMNYKKEIIKLLDYVESEKENLILKIVFYNECFQVVF